MMKHREIIDLLLDANCVFRISNMTNDQLADSFGHEFGILKAYDQNNPHHDRDLLTHTLDVLDAIHFMDLPPHDVLCLALAALLHDVGKPATARLKQNRTVFYGHPDVSRSIADKLLHSYGFSEDIISRVLFLICYHDIFINYKLPSELTKTSNPYLRPITKDSVEKQLQYIQIESITKYNFYPTSNDQRLLLHLCMADAFAQAETVYINGTVTDTRNNKLARLHSIMSFLPMSERGDTSNILYS